MQANGRLVRVGKRTGGRVSFTIDGVAVEAWRGESVLAAVLSEVGTLRRHEFSDERRAGFCLMGACQDCWVWLADGRRVRACTTAVEAGMAVVTVPPAGPAGHG